MDWLRRNWPDLLIVVALIAVIGGIATTLLTGGFTFPLLGGSSPPAVTSTPTTSGPTTAGSAPATTTVPSTDTGSGGVVDTGASTDPSTDASTSTGADAATAASGDGDEADATATGPAPGETDIAILPPSGGDAAASSETATSAATSAATPAASAPSSPAASAPDPAAPTPTAAVGGEAPYRISVGAFGNAANAERLVASFQSAGFPVFTGEQGDLTLVLVGPYDTLGEAETAAERVASGGFGVSSPVIFRLDEGPVTAADAATGAAVSAADSATASASTTGAAAAPAASGTFLQVGAYASSDAAQPQRQRVEALGFQVGSRQEGGLVKLVVGPFQNGDLAAARSTLNAAGVDHFPRSN